MTAAQLPARRNVTAVMPCGTFIAGRCATVTYAGSVTQVHGTAWLVDDCDCPDCARLDPWDTARRYVLRLEVEDAEPGARVPVRRGLKLRHVGAGSFVRACPQHPGR